MAVNVEKIFPVGLALGAVFLAGVFWMHEYHNVSDVSAAITSNRVEYPETLVAHEDIEALDVETERLKAARSDFEQSSAKMKSELTSLRSQLAQLEERSRESVTDDEAGSEPMAEEQAERVEAQVQDPVELIEETILTEKADPEWASSAEDSLSEAFRNQEIKGLELVGVECRTTLCRLELSRGGGSTSPEQIFPKLIHMTPWQGQSFGQIEEGESGKVLVFLAREGYSLPDY